ncbi:MAG: hypothetical protein JSW23_01445, partial [Planctomycetota bacterium]
MKFTDEVIATLDLHKSRDIVRLIHEYLCGERYLCGEEHFNRLFESKDFEKDRVLLESLLGKI